MPGDSVRRQYDPEFTTLSGDEVEVAAQRVDVVGIMDKYGKEPPHRDLAGFWGIAIAVLSIGLSLFHLYAAASDGVSPWTRYGVHLGLALPLVFLLCPFGASSDRSRMHWPDIFLAILAMWVSFHAMLKQGAVGAGDGAVSAVDLAHGVLAILLVLEAARRMVGLPVAMVAVLFLLYARFGSYAPGSFAHPGFSWEIIVSSLYLTDRGIFGLPLQVSATVVFPFILFSSLMHHAGVGKFFVDLALALVGHRAGGPAKVAVLSCCLFGTVSGSSVGNAVVTGAFTIPLMKKVGYSGAFAGAVDSAASTGGQIMPPIMGAAAFIMARYLDIPYVHVAGAALIPALLYFLSVGMMVHMEARRLGLSGVPRSRLPNLTSIFARRGYLLIPVALLVYLLATGRHPARVAFYCTVATAAVAVARNLARKTAAARRDGEDVAAAAGRAVKDSVMVGVDTLESGARSALSVAAVCAASGLILGVGSLTGMDAKIAGVTALLSRESLLATLVLVMAVSLVLGMILPTTAKYIVLAPVAAPAIQSFGVIPLAAHLFIMYFGILADLTPPVALSAHAAAGIARASPLRTGFMAAKLAAAGFLIPYVFVHNPGLLLIDKNISWMVCYAAAAYMGVLCLAFACVGFWRGALVRWQRLAFFAASVMLIFPQLYANLAGLIVMGLTLSTQRMSGRYERNAETER